MSGFLLGCVPRQGLEAKEIQRIVRKDGVLKFIHHHFNMLEGARGPITLQLFADPARENFLGIEINPRFGGGYPMSHAAGVDYPDMLIRELLLDEVPLVNDDLKYDILMLRYVSMISMDQNLFSMSYDA